MLSSFDSLYEDVILEADEAATSLTALVRMIKNGSATEEEIDAFIQNANTADAKFRILEKLASLTETPLSIIKKIFEQKYISIIDDDFDMKRQNDINLKIARRKNLPIEMADEMLDYVFHKKNGIIIKSWDYEAIAGVLYKRFKFTFKMLVNAYKKTVRPEYSNDIDAYLSMSKITEDDIKAVIDAENTWVLNKILSIDRIVIPENLFQSIININDEYNNIIIRAFSKSNCPIECIKKYIDDGNLSFKDYGLFMAIVKRLQNEEVEDKYLDALMSAAEHADEKDASYYKTAILKIQKLPYHILDKLSLDSDKQVREDVARRADLPFRLVIRLLADQDVYYYVDNYYEREKQVAACIEADILSNDLYEECSKIDDAKIKMALIKLREENTDVTDKIYDNFMNGRNAEYIHIDIVNTKATLPERIIRRLFKEGSDSIKTLLKYRKDLPDDIKAATEKL